MQPDPVTYSLIILGLTFCACWVIGMTQQPAGEAATIQQLLPAVSEPPLLTGTEPLLLPAASPPLFEIPQNFEFQDLKPQAIDLNNAPLEQELIVPDLETPAPKEPIAFLPEAATPVAPPSPPPTSPSPPTPVPVLTPTKLPAVERETIPYPWDIASDVYWQQNPTMTYPSPIGMLPGGAA